MTDLHTHTNFSFDGLCDSKTLLEKATRLNVQYLGTSEHVDYDQLIAGDLDDVKIVDADAYFARAAELKKAFSDKLTYLSGLEISFFKNPEVLRLNAQIIKKYTPDYVINSVHMTDGKDYSFFNYGDKKEVYSKYLRDIIDSLDCDYHYDIVGHIGYAVRFAPYADSAMRYLDFKDLFDELFEKVIKKDKIIEVNTSMKRDFTPFIPAADIFEAFFKAGGRKISFGSDTHTADRLLDKYDLVKSTLGKIGFTHFTVPIRGERIKVGF